MHVVHLYDTINKLKITHTVSLKHAQHTPKEEEKRHSHTHKQTTTKTNTT